MISLILQISLLVICLASGYLVWTTRYEHGVMGVISLGTISTASFVGFLEAVHGEIVFTTVGQVIYPALAIFELRHIYVMHKRQRKCETLMELINTIFTRKGIL